MFVQVIQGPVGDREGLRRQLDRWRHELMRGASGYLGSTFGITTDGEAIGIARFETADAARRNSERPEQGAWWAETEKCFSGAVSFHDSSNVDQYLKGGSDDAGFVQVMQGRVTDESRLRKLEKESISQMEKLRPDLIGSIRAIYGNNEFTDVAYFTSEAEARQGEARAVPEEVQAMMQQWQEVAQVQRWYDLTEPWFVSPNT